MYVGIWEVVAVEMCLGYVMVMAWICVPTYVEIDRRPNIDRKKGIRWADDVVRSGGDLGS